MYLPFSKLVACGCLVYTVSDKNFSESEYISERAQAIYTEPEVIVSYFHMSILYTTHSKNINSQTSLKLPVFFSSLRNMFCFDTEDICFLKTYFFHIMGKKFSNVELFPTLDSDSNWLIYFSFFPDSIVNIPRKISWMGDFLVFPSIF